MSSKLIGERAAILAKWFDELDHDGDFLEKAHKCLKVNFDHVERGVIFKVREILREYLSKNYIDQVQAVLKELDRRIRLL